MQVIHSDNAPEAIGAYSQATKVGSTVYLSGQIGLDPVTQSMVEGGVEVELRQIFKNLQAVCEAAGGNLSDIVRFGVYLTDLGNFSQVNEAFSANLKAPFPARSAIEVSGLPKDALVEIDAVMVLA